MTIEAVSAGLVSGRDVVKKLRAQPDLVRRLQVYQDQLERIPLMGVNVVPIELGTLLRSADLRSRYGLLVNDSLVVAAAQGAGIEHLASADVDFRRVKGMSVHHPGDLG
jgi:predicted nucleic acid-binding protein